MDDVVETVKNAKERGKKCTLLIGAGCSVTAGIPTAKGFVEIIEKDYTRAFKRAKTKTYAHCMAELSLGERRDLIAEYVDKAKVNWAHIAIAQLMKAGFVDRVLTTNFDLLFVRACALLGQFPAVYDFAASQLFKAADIPDQAVFYLHGQRTGFVLMNTEDECKRHSELLAPVFEDAGKGRVWLIVGYSGENDPVFDHLAKVPTFDNKLYWVVYKDNEPAEHVRQRLLVDGKYAFYIKGFDADDFFVTLAQRLNSFPPDFVSKPFSHLDSMLEMITPYTLPGQTTQVNVTDEARKLIRTAIDTHENIQKAPSKELLARTYLMEGKYGEVISLFTKEKGSLTPEFTELASWAYLMQGNALFEQAQTKTGDEAYRLFALAGKKYQAALKIKPDKHEALYNWGLALFEQAQTKTGDEAYRLFALAGKKYQAALKIKPDKHEALNNWGLALSAQAKTKTGKEADRLFAQAVEKYQAALKIKPNLYEAINSWGLALADQARSKTGEDADRLFALAGEKYMAALKIKPDTHEALYNCGLTLHDQAKTKTGEEADRLFAQAVEKYQAALKIKPNLYEAINSWGLALSDQAETKTGVEADRLFAQAGEKYQAAFKIKPDYHKTPYNWGLALFRQAKIKTGKEANRLFALAGKKYQASLKIKPDKHEALYNWGLALSAQAKTKTGVEADRLFAQAGEKYQAALKIKPEMHEALNNWGLALSDQAKTKRGEDADRLFAQSKELLLNAESISPVSAAYNIACLSALQGQEEECKKWLEKCLDLGVLPSRQHLEKDRDLEKVREKPWFKAILARL